MPDGDFYANDDDIDFSLPGDEEALAAMAPTPELDALNVVAETGEEPVAQERPRDEQGRFTRAQQEEAPAAVEEPAVETPALFAGKYKSPEELERAYKELESRLGQQSGELSELRRLEERLAAIDQRLQAPQQPQVMITQDLIDSNPAAAAELAYKQENGAALHAAFENWKLDDPAGAALWAASKQAEETLAESERAWEARYSALEARISPAEQVAQQQALSAQFAGKPEELRQFVESDEIVALANEWEDLGQQLLSPDPGRKVRAIEALYAIHRGRASDTLAVTQTEVARATAQQAQAAREEAFVASPSTTSAGAKPSLAEQIAADWDAQDAIWSGWNV